MTEAEIQFAQQQIAIAKRQASLSDEDLIDELCDTAGCNDKKRKIHREQFCNRRRNPHPSERFVRWWMNRGHWQWPKSQICPEAVWTEDQWEKERKAREQLRPLNPVSAFNVESIRECYRAFLDEQRAEMQGRDFNY